MSEPKVGEYLFAARLISTEARSKRPEAPGWWTSAFSLAVATSFLFFLLM
jgi:hypothetical protein